MKDENLLLQGGIEPGSPSLTQIEMIDIGHKSLPIIIEPYLRGYQSTTTNMLVLINYGYLEIDVKGVVQKIH